MKCVNSPAKDEKKPSRSQRLRSNKRKSSDQTSEATP
jgi:hypothetical protein